MSRGLNEDITIAIKELITQKTKFEESTDEFNYVYKYITGRLKKSDTMYFLNKRDVDQNIAGMCEKFCFHGFFRQSEALKTAYDAYTPQNLHKSVLVNRLNVVKFLLCMSDRPTVKFLEKPEEYKTEEVVKEEINWAEYLNEGIERWSPNFDESEDESEITNLESSCEEFKVETNSSSISLVPRKIESINREVTMDLRTNREELLATIQHTWYQQDKFYMRPQSDWKQANTGILWQDFLTEQVKCLICLNHPSIITEYKVLREIIWQLWEPHSACTIGFSGDHISSKADITISSVRSSAFKNFMSEFVPYIEILEYFRKFNESISISCNGNDIKIPRTYRSYSQSVNDIIKPVYNRICDVEEEIRKQETTYTLLKLADELKSIFEPVKMLQRIHKNVIIDLKNNSPLICATTLISRLHNSLLFTVNKLEQDLRLALFLSSLYHYLRIVDCWLNKDDLVDYTKEFVIEKLEGGEKLQISFEPKKEVEDICKSNSFLKIIYQKVLQIGRNIGFLRLLGKFDVLCDSEESIYDEFVKKTLEHLCELYQVEKDILIKPSNFYHDIEANLSNENFSLPTFEDKSSSKNPDMEKLEHLVDTTDSFLMIAFSDFFLVKPEPENCEGPTLYEKISKITKKLFPKANFFENILHNILEERFKISGLIVKKLLIEQHVLERHLQFLRHLYLFSEDMIFPFYRTLFEKANLHNKNWGNEIWLTSHLQDVIMDTYPDFCSKCSVQVKEDWKYCTDSLSACSLININYEISWPLNVIIAPKQMEMYTNIFQFILKLKWALYTINHLSFAELEPNKKRFSKNSVKSKRCQKLRHIKFCLINILNNVQHFIFGFVLNKCLMEFELNFEKAYDLTSLIESHENFINSIYKSIDEVRKLVEGRDKFENIFGCVKLLKLMWTNLEYATTERIADCCKMYETFYCDISPVVFPTYIFDY